MTEKTNTTPPVAEQFVAMQVAIESLAEKTTSLATSIVAMQKSNTEAITKIVEGWQEKSANEDLEATLAKVKAEMEAKAAAEKAEIYANVEAKFAEEKKSVNVSVVTPVKQDYKSLKDKTEEMCEGYILGVSKEHSKEDYKNTLCDYLESAQEQKSMQGVAKQLLNEVKAAVHNTNDFSLGGILLNAPMIIGIQERLFISSPLRQNARIITGRTDVVELIVVEKFAKASFMSEAEKFTSEKAAEFGVKQIRAIKTGAMATFTDKIDKYYSTSNKLGINFVSYITDQLVRSIAMQLEDGYMKGADVQKGGKIEGFVPTVANSFEKTSTYHFDGQKIGFVKSGSPTTFTVDAFADLEAVFPQEFSQGSVYVMNPKTLAVVKKFKTTTGQPLFNQSYGIGLTNGLIQGEIMGRPVILDNYIDDVAQNAFPVGLVNIREYYTIYDAYGDTLVEKKDTYGDVTTVNIRAEKYSTGMVSNPQAAVFLKIAN